MEVKLNEAKLPALKFQSHGPLLLAFNLLKGKSLLKRVNSLLYEGLHCDPLSEIVNVEQMKLRGSGPGIIKVELFTLQDKVAVLRHKQSLRDNKRSDHNFIQSAKSHMKQLINLNFRALHSEPSCGKYVLLRCEQLEPVNRGSCCTRSRGSRRENLEK